MSGRPAFAVALSVLVAVAAGCGGSSSSSNANGTTSNTGNTSTSGAHSSSNPNSSNYDPAATTLKQAGLEVCNQIQSQSVGGLDQSSGLAGTRSFLVAPKCKGKTSANQITVYQFTDRQSLDAGMAKIKAAYPKGQVAQYGAVVILATGPDAAKNMADIKKVIPATG